MSNAAWRDIARPEIADIVDVARLAVLDLRDALNPADERTDQHLVDNVA